MIGRLRAAWDDSRRTAVHRRGTNPISRVEWFEFVDRVDAQVVDKINALPTRETIRKAVDQIRADLRTDRARNGHIVATGLDEVFSKTAPEADDSFPDKPLDKFIAAQNAQTEKYAAEYQEFLRLRRPSTVDESTDGRPDFTEVGTPDSSDAAQGRAFTEAVTARIAHDEHMLAIVHLFGLAMRGDTALRSAAYAFIAANPHVRLKLTDHAKQGGKCSVDDLGVRLTGADPLVEEGDGFERDDGVLGNQVLDGLHDSSPSAGDAGAHSVGEGEVAGVETAAPVTDATDVFAGPGLFRFDGTQVHAAEPATPDDVSRAGLDDLTRQIADYLEVLHDQGNSWSTIARLTRHVFTTPSDT